MANQVPNTDETVYKLTLASYNQLLFTRQITADEYFDLWGALEKVIRGRAIARAKYKVGDRVCRSDMRQPFEIEDVYAAQSKCDEAWQFSPAYIGRPLTKTGQYSKINAKVKATESVLQSFVPINTEK